MRPARRGRPADFAIACEKVKKTRLIAGLLAAEICAMAGFSAYASLLVELARRWHLNPAQAGWISSAYLAGYAIAVPALVGMTDRFDPRAIYAVGSAIGVAAGCGFASLANGFWSAFLFQAMAGMALAGTYMPGLRILTERLSPATRIRSVPYYTATFGVGASLSFMVSGWMAQAYGWHAAFWTSAAGSAAAGLLMLAAAASVPIEPDLARKAAGRHPLDFRPVLQNRDALAYVLAYGGHCWELFGFRAWLPTYLLFAWMRFGGANPGSTITDWATVISLMSVPASIAGAEYAARRSRNRLIWWFAAISVAVGIASAIAGSISFAAVVVILFVYGVTTASDSGALTAGAVAAARPGEQGATLAVYSLVGFAGGALGPAAAGFALTAGGGFDAPTAWYFSFAAIAAGSALAAAAISTVTRSKLPAAPAPAG